MGVGVGVGQEKTGGGISCLFARFARFSGGRDGEGRRGRERDAKTDKSITGGDKHLAKFKLPNWEEERSRSGVDRLGR